MVTVNNDLNTLKNLRDISDQYSIPLSTLRRWASERRFPLYKVSNRIYVDCFEFQSWLETFKINLFN